MKHYPTLTTAVMLVCGMAFTGVASASPDDGTDSDSDHPQTLSRHGPDSPSGSGDTVAANCGGRFDGTDFGGQTPASGSIRSTYGNGKSVAEIKIKNARPNTHYTVWVRLKGQSHSNGFGGSPITGGGATPYAPTTSMDNLIGDWGSPVGCVPDDFGVVAGTTCTDPRANGFVTNGSGKGKLTIYSDFTSQAGGAYPFNRMSAATLALADATCAAKACGAGTSQATPTAIVDPRDPNVGPGGTPFLYRMVSHCLDDASHGVSPGKRETWFNFP